MAMIFVVLLHTFLHELCASICMVLPGFNKIDTIHLSVSVNQFYRYRTRYHDDVLKVVGTEWIEAQDRTQ